MISSGLSCIMMSVYRCWPLNDGACRACWCGLDIVRRGALWLTADEKMRMIMAIH
jgi:hypothetical protein